jgi:kynurenine formamidase
MGNWIKLSFSLNAQTPAYGNGVGLKMSQTRDMCLGHTSNNSAISMPLHHGTHIDFPRHFSLEGKTSTNYSQNDLIFDNIGIIEVVSAENMLLRNINMNLSALKKDIEFLIVKTNFCERRQSNDYWEFGWGFHPETAAFLKSNLPKLKGIGFDLISLNSYQHRETGREAHKKFLLDEDILIVEDMDLKQVTKYSEITELVIAPLWIDEVDGLPVTILAKCQ